MGSAFQRRSVCLVAPTPCRKTRSSTTAIALSYRQQGPPAGDTHVAALVRECSRSRSRASAPQMSIDPAADLQELGLLGPGDGGVPRVAVRVGARARRGVVRRRRGRAAVPDHEGGPACTGTPAIGGIPKNGSTSLWRPGSSAGVRTAAPIVRASTSVVHVRDLVVAEGHVQQHLVRRRVRAAGRRSCGARSRSPRRGPTASGSARGSAAARARSGSSGRARLRVRRRSRRCGAAASSSSCPARRAPRG